MVETQELLYWLIQGRSPLPPPHTHTLHNRMLLALLRTINEQVSDFWD